MTAVATAGPGFKETIICDSVLQLKVCCGRSGLGAPKQQMRSGEKASIRGRGDPGSTTSKGPKV